MAGIALPFITNRPTTTARVEFFSLSTAIIAGHSVVVAQTEDYTYLLRTPSDVEYSESDSALAEAYQALAAQQDFIIAHIKAIC